jgi:hypothetical protein
MRTNGQAQNYIALMCSQNFMRVNVIATPTPSFVVLHVYYLFLLIVFSTVLHFHGNFKKFHVLFYCPLDIRTRQVLPPSLYVCRPKNVSVRETRFSRNKHLGTEGVDINVQLKHSITNIIRWIWF